MHNTGSGVCKVYRTDARALYTGKFLESLPWSAAYTCFCFILIVGLLIALIARIKFVAKSGHMPRHSYAAAVKSSVHIHHGFDNHRILEKTVES